MARCEFDIAWRGPCGVENCPDHSGLSCISCGEQATHECDETGQFVCGAPLCDDCEHTTAEDGTNGGVGFNSQTLPKGMKHHCKKSEQRFRPWYEREAEAI